MKLVLGCSGILFGIIAIILIASIGIEKPVPNSKPLTKACPYEVVFEDDTSVGGRDRITYSILAPTAITKQELAETGIQAAKDLIGSNQYCMLWIDWNETIAGHGLQRAVVQYAPDGKGISGLEKDFTWRIEVNSNEITPQQVAVATAWYENKGKFQTKDGITDDAKLNPFLAKKLNLPESEITTIPLVIREPYPYNGE